MRVHGVWQLTPERVAVHRVTATAVLADLHLGYAQARQRRGDAVPAPGFDAMLQPLARVLAQFRVRCLLVAGDLFEDGVDPVLADAFVAWVAGHDVELIGVVPGNHDRPFDTERSPESWPMPLWPGGFRLDDWLVVHGDDALPERPIVCGHLHPSCRVAGRNWPCYLVGPRRIVLPAYSTDARGAGLQRWSGYRCLVPVGSEVLDFGYHNPRSRRGQRATRRLPG
jgi:metallophosphoesterase superfamily enzyme